MNFADDVAHVSDRAYRSWKAAAPIMAREGGTAGQHGAVHQLRVWPLMRAAGAPFFPPSAKPGLEPCPIGIATPLLLVIGFMRKVSNNAVHY